jgi:hypothetical protein
MENFLNSQESPATPAEMLNLEEVGLRDIESPEANKMKNVLATISEAMEKAASNPELSSKMEEALIKE